MKKKFNGNLDHISRRRQFMLAGVLLIVSTFLTFGICEIIFRLALFSDSFAIPILKKPGRYADVFLDDDYYRLAYVFGQQKLESKLETEESQKERKRKIDKMGTVLIGPDPELGWAPERSSENIFGLITDKPYHADDVRNVVLFFGDSFVAGHTAVQDKIPQILDRMLPERSVLNYGVWDYGVDQIYLRFRKTADQFQDPLVIVGILTRDLDRSVLSLRSRPKPFFDVHDDELVLRNTPLLQTKQEYTQQNPPRIRSYFFRFVMFRLRPLIPERWFDNLFGYGELRARKRIVNRRILRAFKDHAESLNIPIRFVLFYVREEIDLWTWREGFLQETLDRLGVAYFDTKAYLKDYMARTNRSAAYFYSEEDNHLNAEGNRRVAEGIFNWLKANGGNRDGQQAVAGPAESFDVDVYTSSRTVSKEM